MSTPVRSAQSQTEVGVFHRDGLRLPTCCLKTGSWWGCWLLQVWEQQQALQNPLLSPLISCAMNCRSPAHLTHAFEERVGDILHHLCDEAIEKSTYLAITSTILPPSIFTFTFVMLESFARCRSLQGWSSRLSKALQDSSRFSVVLEGCSPITSGTPVKIVILLVDVKYAYTWGGVLCSIDQQPFWQI